MNIWFQTGSIKSVNDLTEFIEAHMFQFHTGSIKRRVGSHGCLRNISSFNSILVRLKEDGLQGFRCHRVGSFNSILVRLKEEEQFDELAEMHEFQFHTGSIKRHSKE